MTNQEVIINIGVSGSGKTTWTTEFVKKNSNYVRINRDDLRKHFYGTLDDYYIHKDLNSREDFITQVEYLLFNNALEEGHSIVVDNTNLRSGYIEKWIRTILVFNSKHNRTVTYKFKLFEESNEYTLKKRVDVRDAPLGWNKLNYIDNQIKSLKIILNYIKENYNNHIYE